MSKKPNLSAIEIYAEKVADAISDDFFSEHDYITGIQITKLSSLQSVNLFILKRIFENWQKEAVRIQSPYFDYSADSVRTSLGHLMNALSKNIHISRIHFLPLLQKAIRDVLVLTFAPEIFYEEFFGMQGIKIPMKNYLIPMFGYIKIHPKLATEILNALQEEAGVNIKRIEAINIANNIIRHHSELQDDPKEIVALFNEIIPVGIFELHPNYLDEPPIERESITVVETPEIDIEKLSEDIVGFNTETPIEEKEEVKKEEESTIVEEEILVEETPVDSLESKIKEDLPEEKEESIFQTIIIDEPTFDSANEEEESIDNLIENSLESFKEEEIVSDTEENSKEEEKSAEETTTIEDVVEEVTFSVEKSEDALPKEKEESESEEPETIQNALQKEETSDDKPTLLDKLQGNSTKATESIRSSMSINQKFLFQKELFGGDATIMENAIKLIDESNDYTEAINLIKMNYAQQYDWDFTSEAVVNFISLVDMKF